MVGGSIPFLLDDAYLHFTGDVLVLPLRYVEELRDLPESVVSSNAANEMVSLLSSTVAFP